MAFNLSKNQLSAKADFKIFVEKYISPFADTWDLKENLPKEVIHKLKENGFLGASVPKEYGGLEMDPVTFGLLCEEIGKGSISLVSLLTVHGMVCQAILKWGTIEQKKTWLPKLAKGDILAAFALSEPSIGSNPKAIETSASILPNGKYLLQGRKKWISFAQLADLYLVIANHETKPTAFLVERTDPNLNILPIKGLYGFRSAMLGELIFNNCHINENSIVGRIGVGFSHITNTALDYGRYCIAWACVGLTQACLESSLSYTTKRKQFGVYLRKHQLIQRMIADMTTNVKAARALCFQAAYLKYNRDPEFIMETSIAKYFASGVALKAANDTVQIHGANGCGAEYPVQRYLRDAKITEIIEGSSQIQQIIISQHAYQQFLFSSNGKTYNKSDDHGKRQQ